eukprot:SAG11_NODE_35957_length_264_cov_0.630303_1_plen_42_part_10
MASTPLEADNASPADADKSEDTAVLDAGDSGSKTLYSDTLAA